MWWSEPQAGGDGSGGCPDLLRHAGGPRSSLSPLYLSFFEEECRAIVTRLRQSAAAEASPAPGEGNALWPNVAGLVTSTPLRDSPPLNEGAPDDAAPATPRSTGGRDADAAATTPGPSRGEPPCCPQPAAGGCPGAARPGSHLAPPQTLSRKAARRGAGQPTSSRLGPAGRPRTPFRSPGCSRLSLSRPRASLGLQPPKAGKALGAPRTRLPQPPGTKLKMTLGAKSRLPLPSGTLQLAQPSAVPKRTSRDTEIESAAKVGGRRQPSQRLSTAIPTVASRSRLRSLGKVPSPKRFCLDPTLGSTTQELMGNRTQELMGNRTQELMGNRTQELMGDRTQELKENGESKERLVAAGTVLGAGKADQTWVCVESSFSSKLAPGPAPGCGDGVPAEQSAGDQLSQELKHVKNELDRVKGELADKTAQCEAYCQVISSLKAQLRAAGICPEDAAVEESGGLEKD